MRWYGRPRVAVVLAVFGFLGVLLVRSQPADPTSRLPRKAQLEAIIASRQAEQLKVTKDRDGLAKALADETALSGQQAETDARKAELAAADLAAGRVDVHGAGVKVTLDDSGLAKAPSGNVNDLVIHSQDVQAVVNALWVAGAEAIAINGQRLVSTSAVLCVGNTLLLNGTVHSPPYVVTAIGAGRDGFEADRLVRRLHTDADRFGLRFTVSHFDDDTVPAFAGTVVFTYATPSNP